MGNTPSKTVLQPEKTAVFKPESGAVYRIPSLIYLKETNTYLAFAEKRNSKTDEDAKCLVMSRGTGQSESIQVRSFIFHIIAAWSQGLSKSSNMTL